MATPINSTSNGDLWHLSIEDLLAPLPQAPRLGGVGPFVINLTASTAPVSQSKDLLIEERAHVYQIQRTEDHRTRYRLRLGPFATEDEADAALPKIRETYPGAFTANAETEDLRAILSWQAKTESLRLAAERAQGEAKAPSARAVVEVVVGEVEVPFEASPIPVLTAAVEVRRASAPVAPSPAAKESALKAPAPRTTVAHPPRSSPSAASTIARPVRSGMSPIVTRPPVARPSGVARRTNAPSATMSHGSAAVGAASSRSLRSASAPSPTPAPLAGEPGLAPAPDSRIAQERPGSLGSSTSAPRAAHVAIAPRTPSPVRIAAGAAPVATPPPDSSALGAGSAALRSSAERDPWPEHVTAPAAATTAASAAGLGSIPLAAAASPAARSAAPKDAAARAMHPPVELPSKLPSLESTQTVRPLTPIEIEDSEATRWYVIQLCLSNETFDPDSLPNLDIFGEYRLYAVTGFDQGRVMHALRLGFFSEQVAAAAVASYLGAFYESPTVRRVSAAERERFADHRFEARKDIGATGRHAIIEITNERVVRERRETTAAPAERAPSPFGAARTPPRPAR